MPDDQTMTSAALPGAPAMAAAEGGLTPDAADHPTLPEDLRDLVGKGHKYALAELAFQKSRVAYAGSQARTVALLAVSAAVLVFFAVMALVVGAVIALAPVIGGWPATAVVTLTLLVVAFLFLLTAKSRWKRTMTLVADDRGAA